MPNFSTGGRAGFLAEPLSDHGALSEAFKIRRVNIPSPAKNSYGMTWLTPAVNGPGKLALSKYVAGTSTVSLVLSATPFCTSAGVVKPFKLTSNSLVATRLLKSALPSLAPYTLIVAL